MDWFEKAKELKANGLNYREIADELGVKHGTVRSRFRREAERKKAAEGEVAVEAQGEEVEELPTTTDEQLKKYLLKQLKNKSGKSMEDLLAKQTSDVTAARLTRLMDELRGESFMIDEIGDNFRLRTIAVSEHNFVDTHWNGDKVIKFGICSDMHTSSIYQQLTHLNDFYDKCAAEGIKTIYNAGDLVEGYYKNRPGHEYEIFNHGADKQVDYVIDNYPHREGIVTKFITGNHDHTHIKNGGYDIGRRVELERDDMEYLGINNATIMLTPNCRMDMLHPGDGSAYALSYSLQKTIEAMPVDDLPQILIVGHHHKAIYLNTRGIHALEAGTFQAQSGWMKGKRLAAHVGGWIITVHVNDNGEITRFIPEWVAYNRMVKHDY